MNFIDEINYMENEIKSKTLVDDYQDVEQLINDDKLSNKLRNIFSKGKFNKKKIFNDGIYTYGYILNADYLTCYANDLIKVKILVTTLNEFKVNPYEYIAIEQSIISIKNKTKKKITEKKMLASIYSNEEEPYFKELPFTSLFTVNTLFIKRSLLSNDLLKQKIIPIVFNKNINKEIIFISDQFYTEEFKSFFTFDNSK